MAPRQATAQRRNQSSQNEGQIFELGVRGRKTGVTLVDTGERDEYGMEPVDNLFSSPDKGQMAPPMGKSQLGPATVSRMRKSSQGRLSIPRARSPVKTHLNSPARHNTHVAPGSSPTRGSIVDDRAESPSSKSVKRRLNFSADPTLQPPTNGNSKAKSSGSQSGRSVNRLPLSDDEDDLPRRSRPQKQQEPVQEEAEEEEDEEEEDEDEEEPMEVLDMGDDDGDLEPPAPEEPEMEDESGQQQDEEDEPTEEVSIEQEKPEPKKRGRKPKNKGTVSPQPEAPSAEPQEAPAKKQRGRPKRDSVGTTQEPAPKKSKRRSDEDEPEVAEAAERGTKKARKEKEKPVKAEEPKVKGKPGRKRKSSGVGPASPAVIPRAPMPKSRGLQILRREGLNEGNIRTTRSGRISTKPLDFWKGERYEYETDNEDLVPDKGGRHIKLATIKSVVRVEAGADEPKTKRRGRPGAAGGARGRPKRRSVAEEEEEEDRSDWEDDPGRIVGECILWRPEYEMEPPEGEEQVEVMDEEIAVSEAAVQMKDIKGASFQFAKTLTLPFFGSGIVDLPPHSEKKAKNSRKMQMVFFVHYGSVVVNITQTQFRIGKGGQFFVPRGNHYSIENNTERPARIFFAQGCEMLLSPEGEEGVSMY
ncbi:cupin domain-containing protein [Apiospora hydei]|uniref:Cupin domain-containing protein n=1 Tax=Apiospora hydei TaxID=1337664 RepID=A0ABR1XCI6_9PEZI